MLSLNVGSNINQVAGWLANVQRKQLPFATAGALTATAFDVRKHVIAKTFPRDFDLRNKRFAGAALRVDKANKRKLRAAVYDRLGREYLETQARGRIKKPTGQWLSVPTEHIQRTASGKIGKAKRPRNIVNKPNVFFQHQGPTPDIVRRPRGKEKQLEVCCIRWCRWHAYPSGYASMKTQRRWCAS